MICVCQHRPLCVTVCFDHVTSQILARRKRVQTRNGNLIVSTADHNQSATSLLVLSNAPDAVVVVRVGERQRQHALLLQVGLVNASERAHNDRTTTEKTRLQLTGMQKYGRARLNRTNSLTAACSRDEPSP